jgi:hypothetical protein
MADQDNEAAQNVMNSFKSQSNTDPNHVSPWQRLKNAFSSSSSSNNNDAMAEALSRKRQSISSTDTDE